VKGPARAQVVHAAWAVDGSFNTGNGCLICHAFPDYIEGYMGRRKDKAKGDLVKGGVILLAFLLWWLHETDTLIPLLMAMGLLILAAMVVGLVVLVIMKKPAMLQFDLRSPANVPLPAAPAPDLVIECPQCQSALVAFAKLSGKPVTCEACRHVFQMPRPVAKVPEVLVPRPALKVPDSTVFHTPSKVTHLTPEVLHALEWKRFEQLVEGYFSKTGWQTRPNSTGADGGVDVHLLRPGQPGVAAVVQCKAWNAYRVGVKPIRELFGVMAADHIAEGFFVTSADYSSEARSFAAGKPLTLIDGADLLKRLQSLPDEHQADLYAKVTAGDYTTPTCPQCGRRMVRRVAAKGRGAGGEFWGCPTYPRCRQTLQMKNVA
jgi:ssDNA-binding Zn-finger/Zn-ribbon topoisomerase 1